MYLDVCPGLRRKMHLLLQVSRKHSLKAPDLANPMLSLMRKLELREAARAVQDH